jgi:phosphatidylinositol-3-phosphatase
MRLWVAVLAMLLLACGPTPSTLQTSQPRHVFIIVMENHSFAEAIAAPYTASLAATNGVAENYYAITHPSLPNYLAITSGQTWGVRDDSYHVLPAGADLGSQLTRAGVSWRAYMEGMTSQGCIDSPVPYDPGHNPFAFYGGKCPPNVVPLTALSGDLATNTPRFVWITPDMCHDTHNCAVEVGDDWLRQQVGQITASKAWTDSGVLFITWDEDDGSADNRVLTLVLTTGKGHRSSQQRYTHYSLLATLEDLLGVGRLANAARANPMTDLVK